MMADTMMMDTTAGSISDTISLTVLDRDGLALQIDSIFFMDAMGRRYIAEEGPTGRYSSSVSITDVSQVCFVKNDELAAGLSVVDLTRGQRIILGLSEGCPRDRIALDVSNDQRLTGFDLVLMKQVLLQRSDSYPGNFNWKFVAPDPVDPSLPSTNCIMLSDDDKISARLRVLGIKLGDARCSE